MRKCILAALAAGFLVASTCWLGLTDRQATAATDGCTAVLDYSGITVHPGVGGSLYGYASCQLDIYCGSITSSDICGTFTLYLQTYWYNPGTGQYQFYQGDIKYGADFTCGMEGHFLCQVPYYGFPGSSWIALATYSDSGGVVDWEMFAWMN